MKYEKEDQDKLKSYKNASLSKEARQKAEDHKRSRLKIEDGVCLALRERQREEEEEQNVRLKAKEEAHLAEEARLKDE